MRGGGLHAASRWPYYPGPYSYNYGSYGDYGDDYPRKSHRALSFSRSYRFPLCYVASSSSTTRAGYFERVRCTSSALSTATRQELPVPCAAGARAGRWPRPPCRRGVAPPPLRFLRGAGRGRVRGAPGVDTAFMVEVHGAQHAAAGLACCPAQRRLALRQSQRLAILPRQPACGRGAAAARVA